MIQMNGIMSNNNRNDRETQFLASQRARLDKLHEVTALQQNDGNTNAQLRRKEFWQVFKEQCSSLHDRLSSLAGQEQNNPHGNISLVTAQQRNEAYEKLQQIKLSLRALHLYTLRSTKMTLDSGNFKFLPQYFAENEMPDLPIADLRLLNDEIKDLKTKSECVEEIVIPKEKFRFKRYRALVSEKKQLGECLLDDDEGDVIPMAVEEQESGTEAKATFECFDGLTLSDIKDSVINVHNDGVLLIQEIATHKFEKVIPDQVVSLEAKAFLVRAVTNCKVQIQGLYNSIHIVDAMQSIIRIISPIHGPVHVTNCHDATILIPYSRQIRIHDCTNISFITHVASGPIIEGCKDMKFYQKDYRPMTNISHASDFNPGMNLYWDVKDFHWLKNHVKSPNFDVFTEETLRQIKYLNDMFASFSSIFDDTELNTIQVTEDHVNGAESIASSSHENNNSDDDEDSSEDEL
mmetsp:Transcript_9697/g.18206  ORF Transcript_9697/g.18206 Transcript_9697/m.18206 type:complete len:462 (-) Transcript_9697:801-2186(-)